MNKPFSLYLDLTRFVAALLVVMYHANIRLLSTAKLPLSQHGHAAVIVFLVLSGYVISYIATGRENNALAYWSSRLARFYVLAVPVVLLCPVLDVMGEALAPQFYAGATTHTLAGLRIVTSLAFLNEVWFVSIMSFSNVPYWSLCYEMGYYLLYGVITFTSGRPRIALAAAVLLLLGPKILLLAPIWWLGVLLHRWRALERLPLWAGWLLFLGSWPAYWLFQHAGMTEVGSALLRRWGGAELQHALAFSKFFMTDYPLALIVAANFAGFRRIAAQCAWPLLRCEKPIRWLASCTFALYVCHQPLLLFFAAAIDGDPRGHAFYVQTMCVTLLCVAVIGALSERHRPQVRRVMRTWLGRLAGTPWWRRAVTARLLRAP